jgi:hypothetical protein
MAAPIDTASTGAVSIYGVLRDFGFPAMVTLILLFQIGPKLEQVAITNQNVATQLAVVSQVCTRPAGL